MFLFNFLNLLRSPQRTPNELELGRCNFLPIRVTIYRNWFLKVYLNIYLNQESVYTYTYTVSENSNIVNVILKPSEAAKISLDLFTSRFFSFFLIPINYSGLLLFGRRKPHTKWHGKLPVYPIIHSFVCDMIFKCNFYLHAPQRDF